MESYNGLQPQNLNTLQGLSNMSSSAFAAGNHNSEFFPDDDIMSIVMKRRLGGITSGATERDPGMPLEKRHKPETLGACAFGMNDSIDSEGPHEASYSNMVPHPNYPKSSTAFTLSSIEDSINSSSNFLTSDSAASNKSKSESYSADFGFNIEPVGDLEGRTSTENGSKKIGEKEGENLQERTLVNYHGATSKSSSNEGTSNDFDFELFKFQNEQSESSNEHLSKPNSSFKSGSASSNLFNCDQSPVNISGDRSVSTEVSEHLNDNSSGKALTNNAMFTLKKSQVHVQETDVNSEDEACLANEENSDLDSKPSTNDSEITGETDYKTENMKNVGEFSRAEELSWDSNSEVKDNAADEVDSLYAHSLVQYEIKQDGKKSRKQNLPKRVPKIEPSSRPSTSINVDVNPLRNVIKSRKQYVPKRVIEESEIGGLDLECYYKDEEKYSNLDNDELKQGTSKYDFESVEYFLNNSQEPEGANSCETGKVVSGQGYPDGHWERNAEMTDLTPDMFSGGGKELDAPHVLPLQLQAAIFAYNPKSIFKHPVLNDLAIEKLLDETNPNLTENLEVVKKLREIRFNRYRKISIAEKMEIAQYAKLNGVTSAAAHYGVSKSAVSMWSHTDFSEIDEDKYRKKKNCLIGNKKYEELVLRVQGEKANKFKGLSREDKFEVSRYAKLIGVREMARCLDIALGTVSGWMRQFPYMIKSVNQEENSSQDGSDMSETCNETLSDTSSQVGPAKEIESDSSVKTEIGCTTIKHEHIKTETGEVSSNFVGSVPMHPGTKTEKDFSNETSKVLETNIGNVNSSVSKKGKSKLEGLLKEKEAEMEERSDEIDEMIAETYETPNVDMCFEIAKEMMKDTCLENDNFFERLFKRVVECRADRYKTLKASEKLEVVRYAKRIGVRRMAKILGLATGTLSGWTTKYQAHLGLTSDFPFDISLNDSAILSELDSSIDVSLQSQPPPEGNELSGLSCLMMSSSSSVLDYPYPEKAEVTAVKLILKERFDYLKDKIDIARKIKFKNISHDEKIEVVKCTKLAGIRPTARVLNMPIGTLSGWITKYTNHLHPVYQEECDRLAGPSVHRPSQTGPSPFGEGGPSSQSYYYNLMNGRWPGMQHLPSLYNKDAGSQPAMMSNEQLPKMNDEWASNKVPGMFMKTESNIVHHSGMMSNEQIPKMSNEWASTKVPGMFVKTESNSNSGDSSFAPERGLEKQEFAKALNNSEKPSKGSGRFEQEAKDLAAGYLKSMFQKFGKT